ncbi:MAG: KAP family NTPase [Desulfuromonadales bacterium]|nr:KAP family NTPase [Desulfuromonadales bacterium]
MQIERGINEEWPSKNSKTGGIPEKMNDITFDTRDEYQRKPIAEKIIHLLEADTKISPLVIDGNWGAGKTEFCRKLIRLIEDGEFNLQPIYVDAFKADHADEPLMTLMAAVLKALPEEDRAPLTKKALPVIKFGVKTALKAGISWVLKQDAADLGEGFENDLKSAGDEVINHAVESLLTDHVIAEESIATLQSALRELAKEKPIVVFIDELDRCRPDFSVNMLESIKHVFEVEGVQFVLIANFNQLRSSINHCYGSALDAQRYLDRFVSFKLNLSDTHKPHGHEVVLASVTHLETMVSNSELLKNSSLKDSGIAEILTVLVRVNQLSLREVETFILHLEIYQSLTDEKGLADNVFFGHCLLRVLGIYLFCFKSDISEGLVRGFLDEPAIALVLGKDQLFRQWEGEYPDCADVVLAMICYGGNSTDSRFVPAAEDQQQWNEAIRPYFQSGGFSRFPTNFSNIAGETIETLKLGG